MNRTLFFMTVLFLGIAAACGNQGSNNSQQPSFGADRFGNRGNFDPEEMAQRQVERLTEQLKLSEEQQKQVYDLTMENFENMQQMRGQMGGEGDFEKMREQMQKAREEQNQKMKSILTDEQWDEYEAYQEEMRARRGQGGPGGFGPQ
ncbi:MAG: hypothetical protein JW761_07095 [Prolixibacteraceae bacterium]|nr:hypothetical protein [Prolixibacteraceae bacterium]